MTTKVSLEEMYMGVSELKRLAVPRRSLYCHFQVKYIPLLGSLRYGHSLQENEKIKKHNSSLSEKRKRNQPLTLDL